jgi:hypothetical protein
MKIGENMTFITVAVISALCLVFASTRKYGVVGTGLLLYFEPYFTIGALLLAGATYYYINRRNA